MAVSHVFTNPQTDATGTVTVWYGGTTASVAASNIQRPSDWNSVHYEAYTLAGNTTQNSTISGTNIVFAASGPGLSVGATSNTIYFSNAGAQSVYAPYFPMSTQSQTHGGLGTTTASALVFPAIVDEYLSVNHVKILLSASVVTSTIAGSQTITSAFGLYTNNNGTLSSVATGSFSIAVSVSSVSGTVSFPTSTGTGGYGYGTSSWSTTANAQSLFGTAGNRKVFMQFGSVMALPAANYFIGLHQRQSTAGAAVGLSTALVGNNMAATTGVGPFGDNTANYSNSSAYHLGVHGFYTSTGSAGYGGTTLPASMILSGFFNAVAVMPLVTFAST